MERRCHHAVGGFRVTVGDRDRSFFVHREHHLRAAVAEVVDDAVVQSAIARARHQRDVRNADLAQHRGDRVAAPELGGLARRHRRIVNDCGLHRFLRTHRVSPMVWMLHDIPKSRGNLTANEARTVG